MAYSKTPTDWFPNYTEDGVDQFTFDIADMPDLDVDKIDIGEATPTGDIAEILRSILKKAAAVYAGQATADKPEQWSGLASFSENIATGIKSETYTFRFNTSEDAGATSSVVDES